MGDNKRDLEQDNSMYCLFRDTYDFSDEDLLKEYEAVKCMTLPIPPPPSDEFENIWARIQEERAESKNSPETDQPEHPKVTRVRFGWKRLAMVGLIACLIAGSGCMVAMATKSYFFREQVNSENGVIYNNDSNKVSVNGEEEAYKLIEQDLKIKTLKLGNIPLGMNFFDLSMEDGYASLRFTYNDEFVYFTQSKFNKKASFNCNSDTEYNRVVYNKWISKDIEVTREPLLDGKYRYESTFVVDGTTYCLAGTFSEDEFVKMIERLTY